MKILKLICVAFVVLFSFSAFAQEKQFYRAHLVSFAFKNADDQFVSGEESPCDILIEISENKLIVYSSELQTYRTVSNQSNYENGALWYAVDDKGVNMSIGLAAMTETKEIMVLVIYSDFSWYYVCKPN